MENKINVLAKQLDEQNQQGQEHSYQNTGIEDTVAETTEKILEETEDRSRDDYSNFYRGRGQNYPINTFQQPSFTPAPTQASYQSTTKSK